MLGKTGFRLSRSNAHKLLYVCMVASVFGSVFSLDLLALTMRYCVGYRPYLKLLESSYTVLFPLVLVVCSISCLLVHVAGIFLCWRLTFINFVWQYSAFKHRCFSIYRKSLVFLSVFISIAIIVNALCLSEAVHKFQDGFKQAISNYHNNLEVRMTMNELQYRFKCCGNQNYKDWFYSPWHSKDFPVLKSQKSLLAEAKVLYLQDTPFSCCNPEVLQPCLHMNILKNNFQPGLSYDVNPTIFQEGCLVSFRNRFKKYLKISVVYLLAFLLAFCLVIKTLVYIASHSKIYSAVYLEYWKKLSKLDISEPATSSKVEDVIKKAKQKSQKIKRAKKFGSFTRFKSPKGWKPWKKTGSYDFVRPSVVRGDATREEIPLVTLPKSLQNLDLETLASEHSTIGSSEAKQNSQKIKRAKKFGSFTRFKSPKGWKPWKKTGSYDFVRPSVVRGDATREEIPLETLPKSLQNLELETLASEHSTIGSSEAATDGLSSVSDSYSQTMTTKATVNHPNGKQQDHSPRELPSTKPDNGDVLTRQEDKLMTPITQERSKRSRKDILTKGNLSTKASSFPSLSGVNGATTKPQSSPLDIAPRRKVVSEGNAALSEEKLTDKESEQKTDGSEITSVADSTNLTFESSSLPSTVQKAKSEQDKSETSSTQKTTIKTPPLPPPPPKPPRMRDLSKNDSSNNRNNFSFSNLDDSKIFTRNSKNTNSNLNTECTSLSYSAKHSKKAEESFNRSSNGKATVGLSTPTEWSTNLTAKSTCHSRNLSNIAQGTPPFSKRKSPEDRFNLGIGSSEFEKFKYLNAAQRNNDRGDCLPAGNNESCSSFHSRRFPSNLLLSDDTESHCSLFDENILEKFYGFRRLPKPNNRPLL